MKPRALTDTEFVDWVRVKIGLLPMSAGVRPAIKQGVTYSPYVRLERLRRLADPDCARCGGSGYYDGDCLDMRCPCIRRA